MKLRIAYFGTPSFAADFLEKLLTDKDLPVEIVLVVTQPDKQVGRKQIATPSPVKILAQKYQIPLSDISDLSSLLSDLSGIDLCLLFAYGKIIPQTILDIPKHGFWNIHPSLLPKYRGPSPIATPLINGDKITGVTLMQMDKKMDHGPIIAQENFTINKDDKRPDLEKKLTDLGFGLFKKNLHNVLAENFLPQDHSKATYTRLLTKQDGFVPWENLKEAMEQGNKVSLYNLFRGLYPWPGIWTKVMIKGEEKRLKIIDCRLVDNRLSIEKVQLEGKKEVDFKTFKKAYLA